MLAHSNLTDYFVTNVLGKNYEISNHKLNMRSQYFEIIDNVLIEINKKFKQAELIEAVEGSNPNSDMFLDLIAIMKSPRISTDNQFLEKLKVQVI